MCLLLGLGDVWADLTHVNIGRLGVFDMRGRWLPVGWEGSVWSRCWEEVGFACGNERVFWGGVMEGKW